MRYPRDPTLDPQLVWKGKDEQDAADLQVPAVPIYIQETIDPLALVEELRAESEGRRSEQQLGFFGPYTDLTFEERVDFYRHAGKWTNRMILGDSLLVMTSLAEKEGLKGQVQTIYVDPPYGIKFGSNWQVSTRNRDVRDGKDTDYDGDAFIVRHAYFTGADDPYDKAPPCSPRGRSATRPGRPSRAPSPDRSPSRGAARSPSRSSPLRRRSDEGGSIVTAHASSPWTTDTWMSARRAKDPINLVFWRRVTTLDSALRAASRLLRLGYTRLAADQWFEMRNARTPDIHRHDVSVATVRDLRDAGSRLHLRLYCPALAGSLPPVVLGSIHRDAPTLRCGINEIAASFDMPRDYALRTFRDNGYEVELRPGYPRGYVQCTGKPTFTDGQVAWIG